MPHWELITKPCRLQVPWPLNFMIPITLSVRTVSTRSRLILIRDTLFVTIPAHYWPASYWQLYPVNNGDPAGPSGVITNKLHLTIWVSPTVRLGMSSFSTHVSDQYKCYRSEVALTTYLILRTKHKSNWILKNRNE